MDVTAFVIIIVSKVAVAGVLVILYCAQKEKK